MAQTTQEMADALRSTKTFEFKPSNVGGSLPTFEESNGEHDDDNNNDDEATQQLMKLGVI